MIQLIVPIEAPPEVAALLLQAATKGLITTKADAEYVWRELVSIAAVHVPANLEALNKELEETQKTEQVGKIVNEILGPKANNEQG